MASSQPPIKYRGGKLSAKEIAMIRQNIGAMTVEQIATKLLRRPSVIKDFLKEENEATVFASDTLTEFRKSDEYKYLQEELTPREIKIFEQKYSKWVGQFHGDILFSEKNQIFNTIKQDILMSKTMQQRKNIEEMIANIDQEIRDIRSTGAEDKEAKERLVTLREQKKDLHGVYSSLMRVYQEQNDLYMKMSNELKASRKQRATKEENRKNTILHLIKIMQNDSSRLEVGEEAELERLSAEAEGEKYRTPIQYLDGQIDTPFISGQG